jgi:hypothetical protein
MNTIFSGSHTREALIYDYSGVWIRRSGGIDWKAIVRNADVVCKPSGVIDDGLNDDDALQVIRLLVEQSIQDALEAGGASASTRITSPSR